MELPQNWNSSAHAASNAKKKDLFGNRRQQSSVSARQSVGAAFWFSFMRALFQLSDYQTAGFAQTNSRRRNWSGLIRADIFSGRKIVRRFSARTTGCFS